MPILKTLLDLKRKIGLFLKNLVRGQKSVGQRRAEGLAAIAIQETSKVVHVRCIAGKNAFTIQLQAQAEYSLEGEPEVASTLLGLRVLQSTPKQVTLGYLFTEKTPAAEGNLVTICWSAQTAEGNRREGTINIDFDVTEGGKPTLISLDASE